MMYNYQYPHPAVTTDIVIFTVQHDELKVLLIQRASEPYVNHWALPGGFIEIDEDLETGAARELKEETGISGVYLEQLYTFGKPDRDPRERVITVAHYALVAADSLTINAASDAKAVNWFSWNLLPQLAFDHKTIISMAHQRLASKLDYFTIALQFMAKQFTLSELQKVYEIILNETLDKRNFRKHVRTYDCIVDTGKERRNGNHRPARLYSVKKPKQIEFIK